MKAELTNLHARLSEVFLEALKDPEKVSAAQMDIIRRFLADNDVTLLGLLREAGADLGKGVGPRLVDGLPFVDGEDGPVDASKIG